MASSVSLSLPAAAGFGLTFVGVDAGSGVDAGYEASVHTGPPAA
ncbi:hypothetical protein [Parafrankia discariae]|nr:hypothetical protein [Parafrankia discariae]